MINDEKELLEWYLSAGVDVFCGDEPFVLEKKQKATPDVPSAEIRPAITDLAQMSSTACKNARELCEKASDLEELRAAVEKFDGCALKLNAKNMVFGEGNEHARVLFVGEAPGADEDRTGQPFVGKCGQLLDKMLISIGLERSKCYITNLVMWRPPGNRTPTDAEIAVCLPFLKRKIELINPDVIVALGAPAANVLLDAEEPISKIRGKWLEYNVRPGTVIPLLPTFHPAYLLRNPAQKSKSWADFLHLAKKIFNN